eukprot:995851-Prymnesium_polylepis.1
MGGGEFTSHQQRRARGSTDRHAQARTYLVPATAPRGARGARCRHTAHGHRLALAVVPRTVRFTPRPTRSRTPASLPLQH